METAEIIPSLGMTTLCILGWSTLLSGTQPIVVHNCAAVCGSFNPGMATLYLLSDLFVRHCITTLEYSGRERGPAKCLRKVVSLVPSGPAFQMHESAPTLSVAKQGSFVLSEKVLVSCRIS